MIVSMTEKIKVKKPRKTYIRQCTKRPLLDINCHNCEKPLRVRSDARQINRYCNRKCFGLGTSKIYAEARKEGVYLNKGPHAENKKGIGTYLTLQCDKEGCTKQFVRKENEITPNASYCSRRCFFTRGSKPDWDKNPLVKKAVEVAQIPGKKLQDHGNIYDILPKAAQEYLDLKILGPQKELHELEPKEVVEKLSPQVRDVFNEDAKTRFLSPLSSVEDQKLTGDVLLAREVQVAKDIAQVEHWKGMGMTDEDIMVMRAAMKPKDPLKGYRLYTSSPQDETHAASFQTVFKNIQHICDRIIKIEKDLPESYQDLSDKLAKLNATSREINDESHAAPLQTLFRTVQLVTDRLKQCEDTVNPELATQVKVLADIVERMEKGLFEHLVAYQQQAGTTDKLIEILTTNVGRNSERCGALSFCIVLLSIGGIVLYIIK